MTISHSVSDVFYYRFGGHKIMFEHKKLLDELLISRNGIEVKSIHFVSDEILGRETKEQLISVGLDSCETIYFSVKGLQYPEKKGLQVLPKNMRGASICIKNGSKINQIILLKKVVLKDVNIAPEYDFKYMLQLCALLHELGHVKDMQKAINFSFAEKPTLKLLEAEAYANTYALNYLNLIGATVARNTLAEALYRLNQSKIIFEKSLYQQVCASIGKGRLKKWVNA